MKPTSTSKPKSYVYAYYLADQIVYVGIGTHTDNAYQSFDRAKHFSQHSRVHETYKHCLKEIDVRILSENLSRKTALAVEGLLIRTLTPLGYLLNSQAGSQSRLLSRQLLPNGNVQRFDPAQPSRKGGHTDPVKHREASSKGGQNKRKYSVELGKELNKARALLRQAMKVKTPNAKTVAKWRKEVERLQGLAESEKEMKTQSNQKLNQL